jgi:hypothetical protein
MFDFCVGPRVFSPLLPELLKNVLVADEYPMVMALYLSIFARIILQNEDVFDQLLQEEALKFQVTTKVDVIVPKVEGVRYGLLFFKLLIGVVV